VKVRVPDYLVYLIVRVAVCVLQALPVETARRLGRRIGSAAFRFDRRHRNVARENLDAAFPGQLSERQITRLTQRVFQHFGVMFAELLVLPRVFHLHQWRRHVRLQGHEPMVRLMLQGRGCLMLTGHFGNWEMVGYALGAFGFPLHSVARPLDNPYLENFLVRFRQRTGQTLITKKGGFGDMTDTLARGELLGILADQNAGSRGLFVEFFGRPASSHKAIALIALDRNAPLVVGYARRVGRRFFYEVGIEEIIDPAEYADDPDAVRKLTQRYASALERIIRRSPEQYLWMHRRWKSQPGDRKRKRQERKATPSENTHS
jgi:Kdo2-lipid IVA lauroyltransferase/acyltransferase